MTNFKKEISTFFEQVGEYKLMVLSTGLNDRISSRMMSIVIFDGKFYFQTDKTLRKYEQLLGNPNISLCIDNIQIEGSCKELGKPADNAKFCELFEKYYKGSYDSYSMLSDERLFEVTPAFMERWIYEDGKPFVETFDFSADSYERKAYVPIANI